VKSFWQPPDGAIVEIGALRRLASKTWLIGSPAPGVEKRRLQLAVGPVHVPTSFQDFRRGLAVGWEDPDTDWVHDGDRWLLPGAIYGCHVLDGEIGYSVYDYETGRNTDVRLVEIDGLAVGAVPTPQSLGEVLTWDFGDGRTIYLRADLHKLFCFKRFTGSAVRPFRFKWQIDEHQFFNTDGMRVNYSTAGHDNADRDERPANIYGRANHRRQLVIANNHTGPFVVRGQWLRRIVEEVWEGDTWAVTDASTRERQAVREHVGALLVDQDIDVDVSADADDGYDDAGGTFRCQYAATGNTLADVGAGYLPRFRWSGVTVPQGATVDDATVTLTLDGGGGGTVDGVFDLHDADSIAALSSGGCDTSLTALTGTGNTVSLLGIGLTGTLVIDVTAAAQALADRVGWAEDTLAGFFTSVTQSGFRYFDDRSGGATGVANLVVNYTAVGGGGTILPMMLQQH